MEPTRDCAGNPINYTDPTGHWAWNVHGSFTYYWLKSFKLSVAEKKAITAGDLFTDQETSYFHNRKNRSLIKRFHGGGNKTSKEYFKYAINYYKAKTSKQKSAIEKQAHLSGKLALNMSRRTIDNMSDVVFASGVYGYAHENMTLSLQPKDYKSNQKLFSAFILGIGLHTLQDSFAHNIGHPEADDVWYKTKTKSVRRVDNNPRFKATKRESLKYIKQYINAIR